MLNTVSVLAIGVVILLHVGFFVLESILWTTPTGRRIFGLTPELAAGSASLALNQGVYNLFLAAGLIWGCVAGSFAVKVFFLSCVVVAGIVGGITAKRTILIIQALPGAIALLLVLGAR